MFRLLGLTVLECPRRHPEESLDALIEFLIHDCRRYSHSWLPGPVASRLQLPLIVAPATR
jgi:hypothetical protein